MIKKLKRWVEKNIDLETLAREIQKSQAKADSGSLI